MPLTGGLPGSNTGNMTVLRVGPKHGMPGGKLWRRQDLIPMKPKRKKKKPVRQKREAAGQPKLTEPRCCNLPRITARGKWALDRANGLMGRIGVAATIEQLAVRYVNSTMGLKVMGEMPGYPK